MTLIPYRVTALNTLLSFAKQYVSTGGFLVLSLVLYLFSDSSEYAKMLIDSALPVNGRFLAIGTVFGLILTYELNLKKSMANKEDGIKIRSQISRLELLIERRHLISDTNSAFTEFKNSGKEKITGEYYIKEILTLSDTRARLQVNSYTQRKINFLVSRIKYD